MTLYDIKFYKTLSGFSLEEKISRDAQISVFTLMQSYAAFRSVQLSELFFQHLETAEEPLCLINSFVSMCASYWR